MESQPSVTTQKMETKKSEIPDSVVSCLPVVGTGIKHEGKICEMYGGVYPDATRVVLTKHTWEESKEHGVVPLFKVTPLKEDGSIGRESVTVKHTLLYDTGETFYDNDIPFNDACPF